jgi:pyrimidine dimer DNA glycosylase
MRLWTLHPRYLDARGLVAVWREALLARAVLRAKTRGYRHHPQLQRFRAHTRPRSAINAYLVAIHAEARARGYTFDRSKIGPVRSVHLIAATRGQVAHEWRHLMLKLSVRSPDLHRQWRHVRVPQCHPLFRSVRGPAEHWERRAARQ